MTYELSIALFGIAALLLLLVASLPVAFAMGVVGVVGFALVISPHAALAMMAADVLDVFTGYSLTVIPMFIFMGQVCFHAGISSKLFSAANECFKKLPGGLAMATVGACAGFGAICGSGPATAATMAAVALPEMRKYDYDKAFAAGIVAAGGGLGMLIPPSVVFIVYGVLTEQSIGKLFIAGILPGLLVTLLFCATIAIVCKMRPSITGATHHSGAVPGSRKEIFMGVFPAGLLFALIMVGMFAGWFTPTEAAAVGAAGSLVIAAFSRKLSLQMLMRSLQETIRTSCMVLVIVATATVFGHFLAVTQLPAALAGALTGNALPRIAVLALIVLFYFIAGCFVDSLALIMLSVPIFYPVILRLNYDPIWFGVLIVLVTQIGVITPPVGVNVYVVSGIDRGVPIPQIFKGVVPFVFALICAIILVVLFPSIVTWLPHLL